MYEINHDRQRDLLDFSLLVFTSSKFYYMLTYSCLVYLKQMFCGSKISFQPSLSGYTCTVSETVMVYTVRDQLFMFIS